MKPYLLVALGAATLVAQPAAAASFFVEVGAPLPDPNGGGNDDKPKFRVVNSSGPSTTDPQIVSLTLALDPNTAFSLDGFTNFGQGHYIPGGDDQPSMSAPTKAFSADKKIGTLTYAPNGQGLYKFDPGAYSSFTVDFGPGSNNDFRNALFNGTNTLTGLFSDGSTKVIKFSSEDFTKDYYKFVSGGVPEPSTWAMMIIGFGLIGGAMRRRQTPSVRYTFA